MELIMVSIIFYQLLFPLDAELSFRKIFCLELFLVAAEFLFCEKKQWITELKRLLWVLLRTDCGSSVSQDLALGVGSR